MSVLVLYIKPLIISSVLWLVWLIIVIGVRCFCVYASWL